MFCQVLVQFVISSGGFVTVQIVMEHFLNHYCWDLVDIKSLYHVEYEELVECELMVKWTQWREGGAEVVE